uniref:B30.2/SPRY domain-containing protein n=1 Tax=Heterorhabditis bacteriophora TaxID=37862 RepID=A0A1I7XJ85_HETBA
MTDINANIVKGLQLASAAAIDGDRELGSLELFCCGCSKWFHGKCLKDLKEFYGLSFMVCYVFHCKDCSPTRSETWVAKQASMFLKFHDFIHMCVTVLANLTAEQLRQEGSLDKKNSEHIYFGLHETIIPYVDANWENLTSMPRRVKNTWHQTLQKTLSKEIDLFKVTFPFYYLIILVIKNLRIFHCTYSLISLLLENSIFPIQFSAADYSSARIAGLEGAIDFPFNKEGYRYFLVEKDPNVPDKTVVEDEDNATARVIPSYLYRLSTQQVVTVSPNDRAYQLRVSDDQLTVTGSEGYCVARATHGVAKGTWYFEVNFVKQPKDSHIRIGWSQPLAVVQACVGYNKFSYGWRSLKGTKFHNATGKKYHFQGFKEGDVLGCLIHLPRDPVQPGPSTQYLPPSHKHSNLIIWVIKNCFIFHDLPLINFKHNYFYETHDDVVDAMKTLHPLPGSKIEFFHNGRPCGPAFTDIYAGFYFPAVSVFQSATIRCNFGPRLCHLPKGALPMSERAEELHVDQTLSDMLYLLEHDHI